MLGHFVQTVLSISLSPKNLYYIKSFYQTYSQLFEIFPQLVGKFGEDKVMHILFSIPWGHHRYIIDKFSENPQRAFYYILRTHTNGWSRAALLNMVDLDSQEPLGKAISNFELTLPDNQSKLAQEITKEPLIHKCYVVYRGRAVVVDWKTGDRNEITDILNKLKAGQ